jgi:hypothetical protein
MKEICTSKKIIEKREKRKETVCAVTYLKAERTR